MVEKKDEGIETLKQNDPESIVQEFSFIVWEKIQKITGVRIKCKDKTIYFPRDA